MNKNQKQITGRFAPSPTGRMHLGNIWVALLNHLEIRKTGGVQILRIEDIDPGRSRDQYRRQLVEDMHWLGIDFDYGTDGMLRQSERTEIYEDIFNRFRQKGLCYPCYCTRSDLLSAAAPHLEDGHRVYAGTCRNISADDLQKRRQKLNPAWRIIAPDRVVSFMDLLCGMKAKNLARDWGDFVIKRRDGGFAYQLACAVDDHLMGINFVLRGRDLLNSTFPQIFIIDELRGETPEYLHVPLLSDMQHNRLSKRHKSLDIGIMRSELPGAEQIIGYLAWLAGQVDQPEPMNMRELLGIYDRGRLPREAEITISPADLYSIAKVKFQGFDLPESQ